MAVYGSDDFGETAKSDESPVTRTDLAAHQVLVNGLAKLTPGIPIFSEEDPGSVAIGQTSASYRLTDPLDGTKEFINRNGKFNCNLALIEDHQPTLGLVSIPAVGLLYISGPGHQSHRIDQSGQSLKLIPRPRPGITRVVASKSHLNEETQTFIDRIAEGLANIYLRLGPTCEWDTAAAHAVVLGVGGTVSDLEGVELCYGKTEILNQHFFVLVP